MRNSFEGYLTKEQLVVGNAYEVLARGFKVGIWDGENFVGVRNEMNRLVVSHQAHWDDGPEGHGCVKPVRELS